MRVPISQFLSMGFKLNNARTLVQVTFHFGGLSQGGPMANGVSDMKALSRRTDGNQLGSPLSGQI